MLIENWDITQIVLTGGPCSGKSTAIARLRTTFEDRGINIITVPESATHLFSGMGAKIGEGYLSGNSFQSILTAFQLSQEKIALEIASQFRWRTLILLDRWVLDLRAYATPDIVTEVLAEHDLTEQQILSARYDGIIHLVTAADGAEEFYTLANNTARTETPEQARYLDTKLKQAYIGSPKIQVVDNSRNFEWKMRAVEEAISHILGIPQPLEIENKYLVEILDFDQLKRGARKVNIEQHYLQVWDVEERIRMRSIDGVGHTYYHTIKRPHGNSRIETERIISPREYSGLLSSAISVVKKDRLCFLYENQYFELDQFSVASLSFPGNQAVLEIELTREWQEVKIPPFLRNIAEVTQDPKYKNQNLAVSLT